MDPDVPLIVPEVNPEAIAGYRARNIIANPNCSTAQLVVALKPLHDAATIKRVVVATYQSVSGAGKKGMDELFEQSRNIFVGDTNELEAVEAGRCPARVQSAWAGRVVLRLGVGKPGGGEEMRIDVTLGQPVSIYGGTLTMVNVEPPKGTLPSLAREAYRFTFTYSR
jgi:hypothetical protein